NIGEFGYIEMLLRTYLSRQQTSALHRNGGPRRKKADNSVGIFAQLALLIVRKRLHGSPVQIDQRLDLVASIEPAEGRDCANVLAPDERLCSLRNLVVRGLFHMFLRDFDELFRLFGLLLA